MIACELIDSVFSVPLVACCITIVPLGLFIELECEGNDYKRA